MELQLVEKGFDYIRKKKKWAFILGTVGFSSYALYKAYHAPFIARKRNKLSKLLNAFVSVAEAVSESSDTIGIVTKDLNYFLQSDSDQVPNSLNQISKITRSEPFSDSLVSITRAVIVGVLNGYQSVNRTDENQTGSGSDSTGLDRVLDKLFTQAGSGFASVVIGSFARNLVLGFNSDAKAKFSGESNSNSSNCSDASVGNDCNHSDPVPKWVNVVCGEKCGELIGNCVQLFVSTLVTVYLDKTMHINTYDDFFAGLTNPKHETRVREMFVSVCNGAIESLVKTSHQVFTSSNPDDASGSCFNIGETSSPVETSYVESNDVSDEENKSGWVSKVSSTLAVPSNRRLVLDVTGRVTFETVRSFMEFILLTLCDSGRRCAHNVHEAVVEIVRYVAAKFSIVVTICVSLCLHVTDCTWAMVPA
ncbi:protein PHLOEM PROTEIN 2-LIKE A10-like [Cicer arietinum]|uniref:Protein PHLOEM PROTEIN 2-LIKE A10-like n=1 Tax=Cicer arietinum TaxID=3827 RepID=A0A1S2YY73_CICAR|nr:protein PHLOEM PROTEIN 2-LIKE A10-like [Cicer arietinum]